MSLQNMPSIRTNSNEYREIIFLSLENWDEIWRRNQFICAGLVRRNPELRILFVSLPRDVTNALRTGRWSTLFAKGTNASEFEGRITMLRPWKLLPDSLSPCRWINEWTYRWQTHRASRKLGFASPVLWINSHWAEHLVGCVGEQAMIYDITDDWTALQQTAKEAALTQTKDAALCQRADAVIVCSERLREMKASCAAKLYLIPNGVDADHYKNVNERTHPLLPQTVAWLRPVLGYTGTIHPERVDVSLVEELAKRFSEATVVLVGPIMINVSDRQKLEAIGNVVFTGAVPYAEIPDYMRAFDVCITPHVVTPFTESLNPIKLWEYLAAGKPIISTLVAGFRDYPELVYLATDAEQFATKLSLALAEDPSLLIKRREEASRHSWEKRLDDIEAVLAQCTTAPDQTPFIA